MNDKDVQLNRYLDHAVLKPEMTRAEVLAAIELGIAYEVKTVCVRPCDIALAKALCAGTQTEVSCVLAFPHGVIPPAAKASEARIYVDLGVYEIDMVANYSHIRSGLWDLVEEDIAAVTAVARPAGVGVKVIFETSALTLAEVSRATEVAVAAQADFVKTSTGFGGGGATVEAVQAMLDAAKGRIKVKPSGGIRDAARALAFVGMGCHRLGVGYTSTPDICGGTKAQAGEGASAY